MKVDVAAIIARDIYKTVVRAGKKGALGFPSLITELCAQRGVDVNRTEKIKPPITLHYVIQNCKEERTPPQNPESHPPPPTTASVHPPSPGLPHSEPTPTSSIEDQLRHLSLQNDHLARQNEHLGLQNEMLRQGQVFQQQGLYSAFQFLSPGNQFWGSTDTFTQQFPWPGSLNVEKKKKKRRRLDPRSMDATVRMSAKRETLAQARERRPSDALSCTPRPSENLSLGREQGSFKLKWRFQNRCRHRSFIAKSLNVEKKKKKRRRLDPRSMDATVRMSAKRETLAQARERRPSDALSCTPRPSENLSLGREQGSFKLKWRFQNRCRHRSFIAKVKKARIPERIP
ncbi:unnamed protein product [Lupinus luteus]|uniref:Uncharacterized protein n=1 Tax=Lupinus luteus TaxID=3873 RepID=A0AAV1YHB0_LUPLU